MIVVNNTESYIKRELIFVMLNKLLDLAKKQLQSMKEWPFQFSFTAVAVNKIAHEANCSSLLYVLETIQF